MTSRGRSVRMFLVDGNPTGIVTAEIMNWTGHVLSAPRSALPEVLRRDEAKKTGVYFLFGDFMDAAIRRQVYIGESDDVGKRVSQHSRADDKDFFERFCILTSKDQNLTKAHARYLENRLTEIARTSGRAIVENKSEPTQGSLPESDLSDMEYFIAQVRIVLPVLGYDALREPATQKIQKVYAEKDRASDSENTDDEAIELFLKKTRRGMTADAVLIEDEVIVREGSTADANPDHATNQYEDLRDQLTKEGALAPDGSGTFLTFTRDVAFSGPSAAAAVIYGRNSNGRTSWRLRSTQQTLKEFQDAEAEAAT